MIQEKADEGEVLMMAGPFQLRDLLGTGGFGEVWYGVREEPFFQEVAVKIPRQDRRNEDALQRFEAERQAMALLNHSNVIRFFEGGVLENGDPYYAMEFVDGVSITEFCDTQAMTIDERIALFAEACDGVAFVHEHGILHRDIKPANLIVDEANGDPTVKLIDFGIARCSEFDEMGLVVGQTLDGALLGTRDYSSPEQIDGKHSELDESSDVFSLGAVLCELLCSVKPLDDKTLSESSISQIVNRLTEGSAIHPSERFSELDAEKQEEAAKNRGADVARLADILNSDLGKIVQCAIESSPENRYSSASDLASDLRRYLNGESIEAAERTDEKASSRLLKRTVFFVATLSILIICSIWAVQDEGIFSPPEGNDGNSESAATTTEEAGVFVPENSEIQTAIQECRQRMVLAQTLWEDDQTTKAITHLRRMMAEVIAGKLGDPKGRYPAQRRNIRCQLGQMLAFYLLETGQVNEAEELIERHLVHCRGKIEITPSDQQWLLNVWNSSLASLLTLQGDVERFRGNPDQAAERFVEAVKIVDQLHLNTDEQIGWGRWWCGHIGLPHGRLADLILRPDSLVVSTNQRSEWLFIAAEKRTPMELYEIERLILRRFFSTQRNAVVRQIAMSFLKETRSWSDRGNLEKVKFCLRSAEGILKNEPKAATNRWESLNHLAGDVNGSNQLPNFTLNRVQSQLIETERWMLQGQNSLAQNDLLQAHGHFIAAQAIADKLARKYPEAPEFRHYSAQVKLRIADDFSTIPDCEPDIAQLRIQATETLNSLRNMDSENEIWNRTLQYAIAD